MPEPIAVGTIFARSWGYDQTNQDYYEIVSVSKTGKTAKARQLKLTVVGEGPGYSDRVAPATGPDRFVEDGRCTRCGNYHRDGEGKLTNTAPGWDGHAYSDTYTYLARHDSLTVTTYGDHAWRWDGVPDSQTALGYGH